MRLVRFGEPGQERPGVLIDDETVIDVSAHVHDYNGSFFEAEGLHALERLLSGGRRSLPTMPAGTVRFGAPIARPSTVFCIGLNYADHARETGMELPDEPVLFLKTGNTVVGPTDDIVLPLGGDRTDWEVELAIIVGHRVHALPGRAEAAAAIAGYCLSNDVSERSFQLERGGQWSKGKCAPTFNPLGPWVATADGVPDPTDLRIGLDLNGTSVQDGTTSTMIFDPVEIVRYLSQFTALEAGDVINTGTPPGVGMGMSTPRYLKAGDVVEPWIDGLGRQRSQVVEHRSA